MHAISVSLQLHLMSGVITSSAYSQCLTATDVGKSSGLIKVEACNVNFKNPLQHFELYTEGC